MVTFSVRRLFLCFFLLAGPMFGQEAVKKTLTVAVTGQPPFVMQQDGVWSGLSVEIWEKVAAMNSWNFVYKDFTKAEGKEDPAAILAGGDIDMVIGDLDIVSSLLGSNEFSQPYFRSGLQIMVTGARPHTLRALKEHVADMVRSKAFWIAWGVIAISTILVTIFESKHNPDFPKKKADAVAEAFYYVISLGLGKSAYKGFPGWFGRMVMVIWLLAGFVVAIYLTSSLTAFMTKEAIMSSIAGPMDLPGRTVGTLPDKLAKTYLQGHRANVREYPDLPTAVQGLLNGEVPAIVASAPLLQYYDANHPELDITEVGPIFMPFQYGFAFPSESPLRVPFNKALIHLQETGMLTQLGVEYFGAVYQP